MVTFPKKAWLPGIRLRFGVVDVGTKIYDKDRLVSSDSRNQKVPPTLGILAFEAARTMSRLVALHRVLSDSEILNLRSQTMRSEGVAYLNSSDQYFLLRLAAAEMIEELDRAAEAIVRLSSRGRAVCGKEFQHLYLGLKSGGGRGLASGFSSKGVEKKIKRMEKYIVSTSDLHGEMEILAKMEASERKLENWKNYSGPLTPNSSELQPDPPGAEGFLKKLAFQRKTVRKIQQESLWEKSYEKVMDLMMKAAVTIFARICSIFAHAVVEFPSLVSDCDGRFRFVCSRQNLNDDMRFEPHSSSGPLERPFVSGPITMGNSGPLLRTPQETKSWTTETLKPGPYTVGYSGLAVRYAEVIVAAERMLSLPETVGEEARISLYGMLPCGIRKAVRTKLRRNMMESGPSHGDDESMAEGWREAAKRILRWLGPIARDTNTWQSERSCERKRFFDQTAMEGRKVLVLQTLMFSDREKTEAAIVEMLVGLSCVCRYSCEREEEWD